MDIFLSYVFRDKAVKLVFWENVHVNSHYSYCSELGLVTG